MKTDDLIATLAADQTRETPVDQRLLLGMGGAMILSLAALVTVWGLRDGIGGLLMTSVGLKTWTPVALGLAALALARDISRPESRATGTWALVLAFGGAMAAWFAYALWLQGVDGLMAALASPNLVPCIVSISLLSIPGTIAALWALRTGAASNRTRAGVAAGLLGATTGAAAYSLHCPEDVLLFCLPAYGATMGGIGLIGWALGRRFLRW